MNRNEIIKALETKGVKAEAYTTNKNRVKKEGIRVMNGAVSPIIYTGAIIANAEQYGLTADQVAEQVLEICRENEQQFDIEGILAPFYVSEHIRVGLQRTTDEDIVKSACEYEDIEQFLYIDINNGGANVKVNQRLLDLTGLDEDKLWCKAYKNTFADTTIQNMAEIIPFIGSPDDCPMWVVRNKTGIRGAAAALDREALRAFAEKHNTHEIMVIPASIHEVIIIPKVEYIKLDDVTEMVMEINRAIVAPEEQLSDRAYLITV